MDLFLYDGLCGLCNRTVRFLLRRDRSGHFRFAPLQSSLAREVLARHGWEPSGLETVYVVADHGTERERVLRRSRALLHAFSRLGWPWRLLMVLWPLPSFLLDLGYRCVARVRYRFFGQHETCPVPTPEERSRFLGFEDLQGSPEA